MLCWSWVYQKQEDFLVISKNKSRSYSFELESVLKVSFVIRAWPTVWWGPVDTLQLFGHTGQIGRKWWEMVFCRMKVSCSSTQHHEVQHLVRMQRNTRLTVPQVLKHWFWTAYLKHQMSSTPSWPLNWALYSWLWIWDATANKTHKNLFYGTYILVRTKWNGKVGTGWQFWKCCPEAHFEASLLPMSAGSHGHLFICRLLHVGLSTHKGDLNEALAWPDAQLTVAAVGGVNHGWRISVTLTFNVDKSSFFKKNKLK